MEHMTAEQYRKMTNEDKDMEQAQRNRVSSARGWAFENLLMKGCNSYIQKGMAIIHKVSEPYKVLKKTSGNRFNGVFTGRAEPDFKGVLFGGRAIAFEAKSTQRNVLTDTQMAWLREQNKFGAVTFVAVNIQDKFYSVPFDVWDDMKLIYNKKFLMHDDITDYEVIYDGAVRFLEYKNGTIVGWDNEDE